MAQCMTPSSRIIEGAQIFVEPWACLALSSDPDRSSEQHSVLYNDFSLLLSVCSPD